MRQLCYCAKSINAFSNYHRGRIRFKWICIIKLLYVLKIYGRVHQIFVLESNRFSGNEPFQETHSFKITYSFFSHDEILANCTSGSNLSLGFSIWTRETLVYPKTSSAKTFKIVETIWWVSLELVRILMLKDTFP